MNVREQYIQGVTQLELGDALVKVRARGNFHDQDAMDFVPTPESLLLLIDTPNFDGPLDLLLHLIRKHSMDIFDIPIAQITQKYLAALDEMRALNLDVAGEFLVMAATLTEIKSKMLLPKQEQVQGAEEEEGEDPRRELIKRLLVYKSFQDASLKLLERPCLGRDFFYRTIEEQEKPLLDDQQPTTIAPLEIFELVEKLSVVLMRAQEHNVHVITRDRISVSARIRELIEYCQIRTQFSFSDALRFFPIYEKVDVIVTFLAVLEMSRLKLVRVQMSLSTGLMVSVNKESFYSKQDEVLLNLAALKGKDEL